MQNFNLRHLYFISFWFLAPFFARLASKFEKVLILLLKNFWEKILKRYKKAQNFMLYLYRHRVSESRIGLIHGLHLHEAVPGSSFLHNKLLLPVSCWVPRSFFKISFWGIFFSSPRSTLYISSVDLGTAFSKQPDFYSAFCQKNMLNYFWLFSVTDPGCRFRSEFSIPESGSKRHRIHNKEFSSF